MMKKILMMILMAGIAMQTNAQWTNWNTTQAVSGGIGILGSIIASSERKKAMEIFEREKAQYQSTFASAYDDAKKLEAEEKWADALDKFEEAAKLNCDYGYTDQKSLTLKINSLYEKAGRTEEGPSVLNNKSTILPDYSRYRFSLQNPISKGKKDNTQTRIVRVSCSDTETRIELECEADMPNDQLYIKSDTYIRSKGSDKLRLRGVENVSVAPVVTEIPWPYQKLRFALIFPALPITAEEFELVEPSSSWKFRNIRCR